MGLVDKEALVEDINQVIYRLLEMYGEDPFLCRAINLIRNTRDLVARRDVIDPVHYAGGCYCRECAKWWCSIRSNGTMENGFCSYGRRREVGISVAPIKKGEDKK